MDCKVRHKLGAFAWAASKGKIPTEDKLKRRNFSGPRLLVDALFVWRRKNLWIISLCVVGGFHCFRVSLSLMGVSWVQPSNVRDVVVAWRRRMKKSWILGVCNMVPLAIWWATWKERNRCIFEDKTLSFKEYKLYCLRLSFSWSIGLNGNKNLNFLGFVDCIMDESLRP